MRFYKNLSDDLHCFQAAILIVLSKYFPEETYTYEDIDKITGFKKNAATWDSKGLLWLAKKGFQVERLSEFDYERFAKEGEKYLRWYWKPEVYEWQTKNTDFKAEQQAVQKLLPHIGVTARAAKVRDIEKALKNGFTIIASINPLKLDRKVGYGNHSVVILSTTDSFITFHDPGLPPTPNRRVSKKRFGEALHDVIALRHPNFY